MSAGWASSTPRREIAIDLDRDEPRGALEQRPGQRAEPRTDLHQGVAGPRVDRRDDLGDRAGVVQEVLSEPLARNVGHAGRREPARHRSSSRYSTYARSRSWRSHSSYDSSLRRSRSTLRASRRWRSDREIGRAPLDHLDQVEAEGGAHRLGDLARLQRGRRPLELRHEVARHDPAEIAAARRGGGVVGVEPRELREVGALDDPRPEQRDLAARLRLRHELADPREDVPHVGLLDDERAAAGAAAIVELEQVKPGRAAQDVGHFAGLELRERGAEDLRQPVLLAPAHVAALQRVGRVGVAHRDLAEVRAAAHLGERIRGAPAARLDLLGARVLGDAHQDVRDVVLRRSRRRGLHVLEEVVDVALGAPGSCCPPRARAAARSGSRCGCRRGTSGTTRPAGRAPRGSRSSTSCSARRSSAPSGRSAARRRARQCRARTAPARGR